MPLIHVVGSFMPVHKTLNEQVDSQSTREYLTIKGELNVRNN